MEDGVRPGFSFGFGLAGLLAAGLTYFSFDVGLFKGPVWLNVLMTALIGGGSAALMLSIERAIFRRRRSPGTASRPAKIKGEWGCPRCGAAYVPEAVTCSDCGVPLVSAREAG